METRVQKPVQQQHTAVVVPFQEKQIPQITTIISFSALWVMSYFSYIFETALLS